MSYSIIFYYANLFMSINNDTYYYERLVNRIGVYTNSRLYGKTRNKKKYCSTYFYFLSSYSWVKLDLSKTKLCIKSAPYLQQKGDNWALNLMHWYWCCSLNYSQIASLVCAVQTYLKKIIVLNLHQIQLKFVPNSTKCTIAEIFQS